MDEMSPDDVDAWVQFWVDAGRRRIREIEDAIMRSPAPEAERAAAHVKFRESLEDTYREPL